MLVCYIRFFTVTIKKVKVEFLKLDEETWGLHMAHIFEIPELHWGQSYLPTPPLGQDMTQGQFLSGV